MNRFVTIDPESETREQRSWNPYHFSFNNSIRYSDPDGRNPIVGGLLRIGLRYVVKRVIRAALTDPKPSPAAVRQLKQIERSRTSMVQRDATNVHLPLPLILQISKKEKEKQKQKEAEKEEEQKTADPTPNEVVSPSVKKSKSWHDKYADKTLSELEKEAKNGDKKAAQMAKLLKQNNRLLDKPNKK